MEEMRQLTGDVLGEAGPIGPRERERERESALRLA